MGNRNVQSKSGLIKFYPKSKKIMVKNKIYYAASNIIKLCK